MGSSFNDSLVPRYVWGANPVKPIARLEAPATYVMFGYTEREFKRMKKMASKDGGSKETIESVEALQKLQANDMRRFNDIRFNFVIGSDGTVYEGRGWTISPTLPSRYSEFRKRTIYIGYLGKEWEAASTEYILQKRREIIKEGVKNKHISDKAHEIHLSTFDTDRLFLPNISEIP